MGGQKRVPVFVSPSTRDEQTFSVKDQTVNVLGPSGHTASDTTTQVCHPRATQAIGKRMGDRCVTKKPSLTDSDI